MSKDLRFALLFNYQGGCAPVFNALKTQLAGSEESRGALIYKRNVLQLDKNPLQGEDGELFDHELFAFPLDDDDLEHQRLVYREVRAALAGVVGEIDVLAEDYLIK